jgi:regulator of cell morphogenesis and NO signaling
MNVSKTDAIGFIVAQNIEAADIFNAYGIDYYAHGSRTVEDACIEENVPIVNLLEELWAINTPDAGHNFADMDLVRLSTYILRNHHKFAEQKVTFIKHLLNNLVALFGEEHPDLLLIKNAFDELSLYLTVHMKYEEFIVFPYIQKMARGRRHHLNTLQTIKRPILSMKEDHDHEVLALKTIADLIKHYHGGKTSDYAITTAFNAIRELEEDLKIHMHLENNLLFPKAMQFANGIDHDRV